MRKFIYFLLVASFWSCGEKTKGFDSKIYTEKQVSDFIRVNPKWTINDAETTERFKHRMINMSNEEGFLKDFPFQLMGYLDTALNGERVRMAIFRSYVDDKRAPTSLLNNLVLRVDAIVSEQQEAKLKLNAFYTIAGTVFKQGKRKDISVKEDNGEKVYFLGEYTFLMSDFKLLK